MQLLVNLKQKRNIIENNFKKYLKKKLKGHKKNFNTTVIILQ